MGHAILTNVKHVLVSRDEEGRIFVSEVWGLPEKARRVLQAAAVEAYGRTGTYVTMTPVMNRANISDLEEFWSIAQYLEGKGWIAEADPDYGVFVLTNEGIDEATM
jgi:predicted transcriptional regulator